MLFKIIKSVNEYYQLTMFRKKWKIKNLHNHTNVKTAFPLELVSVGRMSYGVIDVKSYKNSKEKLEIGNFVSIADGVIFIMGGNHQIETITTYPLYSKFIELSPEHDALTKGSIIVDDEVWIGYGATILSGVKIGKGAVVAACSVVSKDVPPYAIVGGNPAKIIRYRFSKEKIEDLMKFNLSSLTNQTLIDNIDKFYSKSGIDIFLSNLNK